MDIEQLLAQKELMPISLVAGHLSKKQEIRSITMMDAPDIIPFLRPHEFIITTAYHLKNNLLYFKELIVEMKKANCAGIGIKKNRFLYEVPSEILQLADELNVSFIELPEHLSLGQINLIITEMILHSEASVLNYAMDIHRQFTDIIFKGQGVARLVKYLASIIERDVQLISQFLRPIHLSQQYIHAIAVIQQSMKHGFIYPISTNTAWYFSILSDKSSYSLYPIDINSEKHFLLMVKGFVDEKDTKLRLTIEQAINVLSFAILQEKALQQQKRNIRNQQFFDLLENTHPTSALIKNKAEELGIPFQQSYISIVGRLRQTANLHPYQLQILLDQIHKFCEEALQASHIPIYIFMVKNELIFVLELQDAKADFKLFITELFKELYDSIVQYFDKQISFGVSNTTLNFSDIQRSVKEAQSAVLVIGARVELISFYKRKEINELLQMIPENDLMNYQQMMFKEFATLPLDEQMMLLETLYEYLEHHCQISETAKRLFVHRNTVIYRLEKCSALLKKDLKDPEVTIQLRLALRIRNHLMVEQDM
ncbi:MAG: PucR family transcriptional regulator ligand-binding domain-containing protein [Solibacillus sp.]